MTTTSTPSTDRDGREQATVIAQLAELATAMRPELAREELRDAASRAVVDWFAATIAGSVMPPARLLSAALLDDPSTGPARLVPGATHAPARTAALINATASHTVEMDDIYRDGIYHPGSPTVGAALALAEQLGASGAELLDAVVVGYEVGDRIAETVNPAHYRYWHTTGTVGTIGAAAATAQLLQLDSARFAHALATATTTAAGLQQAFRSDTMSKPLHAGHAAEAGMLAALAAAKGYTGALDILEGAAGFGAAMAADPDWSTMTRRPPDQPGITRATVKNHACCGHTFAAVDGALNLRASGIPVSMIDSIRVETYTTATKVAGNPDPRSVFEAKFSIAYCIAAALHLGTVRLRAFEPDALADPAIRALAERVTVVPDAEMESAFPGKRQARVTITDADGETYVASRDTRKGDPDDPLTRAELAEKFTDLVEPVVGSADCAALGAVLWDLASLGDVRELPATGIGARP